MALYLPHKVPIATLDKDALSQLGTVVRLGSRDANQAVALRPANLEDEPSVWVDPGYDGYRAAWNAAAHLGVVDHLHAWGPKTDLDHLYPRSWARLPGSELAWIRLFPVWGEVNRSAGQREKRLLDQYRKQPRRLQRVVFADELQVLKIIGYPFEGASHTPRLFSRAGSR